MKKYRKRPNLAIILCVSVATFIFLFIAIFFLRIEIRYRTAESKIGKKEPETRENAYYFNLLSAKEQSLYNEIKISVETDRETTDVLKYRFSEEEFKKVTQAFIFDDPSVYYIRDNSFELYSDVYKSYVKIPYSASPEERKNMNMEIEAVSAAASAYVKEGMNDFEKEAALHDFLTRHCKYIDETDGEKSSYAHTAYGALVGKEAYCDGYAAAFKILLERNGIECIISDGYANGTSHTWNVVRIDGAYSNCDVTWDDPDTDFSDELAFHGYFNLSDEELKITHKFSELFEKPECSEKSDYYTVKKLTVNSSEEAYVSAYDQLKYAFDNKLTYIELYPQYETTPEELSPVIFGAIKTFNQNSGTNVFSESCRFFRAKENGNQYTIEIYFIENQ